MKMRVIILAILLSMNTVYADNTVSSTQSQQNIPITQPQNIAFENCSKMFAVNKEKLFYLTLSGVTANKFSIDEIQSNNGYIIFSAANKKYLATVAGIDSSNAILKITPCNNTYFFPSGIYIGMFKYIELNLNTEIK